MKQLYAFVLCLLCASNVFAQRQPELSILHYWSKAPGNIAPFKAKDDILIATNQSYYLQWRIVNNGSTANDTIAISDTVKVLTSFGKTYQIVWGQNGYPPGMKQKDTVYIEPSTNPIILPFYNQVTSQDSVITNWCDSVYLVSGDITNQAVDPDVSNNVSCDSVLVTYWMTEVRDQNATQGVDIFPNPVANKLNITCGSLLRTTTVEVFDVLGRLKLHKIAETNENGQLYVDVTAFQAGTYMLKLSSGQNIFLKRFFVSR